MGGIQNFVWARELSILSIVSKLISRSLQPKNFLVLLFSENEESFSFSFFVTWKQHFLSVCFLERKTESLCLYTRFGQF